jgi:hypothetical protein
MFDLSPRITVWLQFRVLPKTAMVCEQGLPTVTSLPTKTRVTRSAGCNPDHKAIERRQPLRYWISAGPRAELVHSASSLVQQRRRMEQLPGNLDENDAFARQHIQIYQAYMAIRFALRFAPITHVMKRKSREVIELMRTASPQAYRGGELVLPARKDRGK